MGTGYIIAACKDKKNARELNATGGPRSIPPFMAGSGTIIA